MTEKFTDKISYEFTMASGDIDWSDCNLYIERKGEKAWLGTLASERQICSKLDWKKEHDTTDWLTYEDLEDIARKFCASQELYMALDRCDDFLREVIRIYPQLHGLHWAIQIQLEQNKKAILKARGEE